MRTRRYFLYLAVAFLVALTVVGCSSKERVTTEATRVTTPSPVATEPQSDEPTPPPETPTPEPVGQKVEVVSFHSVKDEYGSLDFIGEVTNVGDEDAASIQVVLSLTDGQGNVVGTGTSYVDALSILPPGETIPFDIYVSNPPASWAKESIQVQAEAADSFSRSSVYSDLEASGVTIAPDEYLGVTVRGVVKNTGTETAQLVQVTFAAYDSAGAIQAVDFTFANLDQIAPGGTSPFEISVLDLDAAPASYKLFVEGNPQ